MSTSLPMELVQDVPPNLKARMAGGLYVITVGTAVYAEFIVPGRVGIAGILIPVLCYTAVTLLLYSIFKPVNRSLALLAVFCNLAGFALEALPLQPHVNIDMIFHGFYCFLIGYLIFRSTFLPRILGASMVFAGLVWMIYLSPPLAHYLSPYNSAAGLLGEGLPMLWLLVMGVHVQRWRELASAAEG